MTDQLLKALNDLEESPWAAIKKDGKSLDARGLAQRVGRYVIKSRNIRDAGGKVLKGYMREDFIDAWARYLPAEDDGLGPPPMESATSATPLPETITRRPNCVCTNQLHPCSYCRMAHEKGISA